MDAVIKYMYFLDRSTTVSDRGSTDTVRASGVCVMHGQPQWKKLLQCNHKLHSQAPSVPHFTDDLLIISHNPHTHSPPRKHVHLCVCVCGNVIVR